MIQPNRVRVSAKDNANCFCMHASCREQNNQELSADSRRDYKIKRKRDTQLFFRKPIYFYNLSEAAAALNTVRAVDSGHWTVVAYAIAIYVRLRIQR